METIIVSMETFASEPTENLLECSGLEVHIGYWLRRVSNRVSERFARSLEAQGVSVAEWVALKLVHERRRTTAGRLAEAMDLTKGAVSKVIEKLETKGWAERTADASDGRVQWLVLTRSGARLVPKLEAIADDNDAHFFACLSADERDHLTHILRKLTGVHQLRETPVA